MSIKIGRMSMLNAFQPMLYSCPSSSLTCTQSSDSMPIFEVTRRGITVDGFVGYWRDVIDAWSPFP